MARYCATCCRPTNRVKNHSFNPAAFCVFLSLLIDKTTRKVNVSRTCIANGDGDVERFRRIVQSLCQPQLAGARHHPEVGRESATGDVIGELPVVVGRVEIRCVRRENVRALGRITIHVHVVRHLAECRCVHVLFRHVDDDLRMKTTSIERSHTLVYGR